MNISRRGFLGVAAVAAMTALASGCGGSNSGGLGGGVTPVVGPFAGAYTGSFAGQTASGDAVRGTVSATADNAGVLTGTVTQQFAQGPVTFPATGTISNSGAVTLTATPQTGVTSTLSGTATTQNGIVTIAGTFETRRADVATPVVTGRFTAIRAAATTNPYRGTYTAVVTPSGTNGAQPSSATFTVDANGSATGNFTGDPGLGTYPLTGTVTPSGVVKLFGVFEFGIVNNVTATGTLTGSAATLNGTFQFTRDGANLGEPGTFRATRTSTTP